MENLIKKMMVEDPYYGFLLTTIERQFSDEVPTMAVTFDRQMNPRLLVNRDFFDTLTETERLACLKHELLHLAFKHVVLNESFPNTMLFNIAADLEVNSYIGGLPASVLYASDFGLPFRKGTAFYYNELSKLFNSNQSNSDSQGNDSDDNGDKQDGDSSQNTDSQDGSSGSGTKMPKNKDVLDDHSKWKECLDRTERELASELINNKLLTAADSIKGRGIIPGELSSIIADLQKPLKRVFDWKKMLRRFIGNAYDEKKKSSRRKESRRFAGSCGNKHLKKSHILVGIDTSGSVSEQELHEFVSELTYMYKAGTEIYVLECDAMIHRQYWFKPGCIKGVSGRGGTNFDPVIDYYKEHYKQFDTLIYLTDGEAPYNHIRIPQNNMLWVISSRGSTGNYPGKTLYIPKTNN